RVFRDVDWQDDPDWDWTSAVRDEPAGLRALHDGTVVHSRAVVSGEDLGAESVRANRRTGEKFSLRWIVLHMIEEYARHNGHADLIRE
ncbi:mycothiol transferase, partial [Neisseria sp. P0015.S009]|uniref:mycothiol transferase n=1 Tax=Neisseria sp. P0015.S009 TaxID=3436765 RepID=UPI003F81FBE9